MSALLKGMDHIVKLKLFSEPDKKLQIVASAPYYLLKTERNFIDKNYGWRRSFGNC
jgi:hypothetical protein